MLFVVMYIILIGILAGYLFIKLCQKCWQVPASIIVVAMLLLMIIFVTPAGAEEITAINTDDIYVRVGIIEDVDEENVAYIRDGAGVIWLWEKEEDDELEEDDIVGFLVQKSGDPKSIFDDIILQVYYGGII